MSWQAPPGWGGNMAGMPTMGGLQPGMSNPVGALPSMPAMQPVMGMGMTGVPDMTNMANMGGYTPEQWTAMQQQNWQQWQQWQQQYAQWHNQYGTQYAEQMKAAQSSGMAPPLPAQPHALSAAPPPPSQPPPDQNNQPLYNSTGNQHNSIPTKPNQNDKQPPASDVNAEALKKLAEEEKLFDDQFKTWEQEFEKWKQANVNHPDKKSYMEYEKKFATCRAQLLERREQMKLKREKLLNPGLSVQTPASTTNQPTNSTTNPSQNQAPQPLKQPQQNRHESPLQYGNKQSASNYENPQNSQMQGNISTAQYENTPTTPYGSKPIPPYGNNPIPPYSNKPTAEYGNKTGNQYGHQQPSLLGSHPTSHQNQQMYRNQQNSQFGNQKTYQYGNQPSQFSNPPPQYSNQHSNPNYGRQKPEGPTPSLLGEYKGNYQNQGKGVPSQQETNKNMSSIDYERENQDYDPYDAKYDNSENFDDSHQNYPEYYDEEVQDDDSNSFLPTSDSRKGIPGLDLVPEDSQLQKSNQSKEIFEDPKEKTKNPNDLSAISKGIFNILGDEKILNILSMVKDKNNQNLKDNLPQNNMQNPYGVQNKFPVPPPTHQNSSNQMAMNQMPPSPFKGPNQMSPSPLKGPNQMGPGPFKGPNQMGQSLLGGPNRMSGPNQLGPQNQYPGNNQVRTMQGAPSRFGGPNNQSHMVQNQQNYPSGNMHRMPNQGQLDQKHMTGLGGPGRQDLGMLQQGGKMLPQGKNIQGRPDFADPGNQWDNQQGPGMQRGFEQHMSGDRFRPPNQGGHDMKVMPGAMSMPMGPAKSPEPKWADEPIMEPFIIVDYEHKPLRMKVRDFIEPVQTFDYNHIPKSATQKPDFDRLAELDMYAMRSGAQVIDYQNKKLDDRSRSIDRERSRDRSVRDDRDRKFRDDKDRDRYDRRSDRAHDRFGERRDGHADRFSDRRDDRLDDRFGSRHDEKPDRKDSFNDRRDDRYGDRKDDRFNVRRDDRFGDSKDERLADRKDDRIGTRRDDRSDRKDDRFGDRRGDRYPDKRDDHYGDRRDDRFGDRRDDRNDRFADRRDDRRSRLDDFERKPRGGRDQDRNSSRERDSKSGRPERSRSKDSITSKVSIQSQANRTHIVMIDDILEHPGREVRPQKIVIILRGPPGSGKTYLAKLIKEREVENGGSAPRILSIDDYFTLEGETEEEDPATGKLVKKPSSSYKYDESSEESYMNSLKRAFRRTVTDGYFPFIIVDAVNDQLKTYAEMWNFARQNGFQVYICTLDLDPQVCFKRNIHNRTLEDIEIIVSRFYPTPAHHISLDATTLLQNAAIQDVQMEDVNSDDDVVIMEDAMDDVQESTFTSKWEKMDDVNQLARLDGTSKPLRPSQLSLDEYLQLDDWQPSRTAKPGKKSVRWADIEERRQQEKMRAIGFVVGQTDWHRMTDPTQGSSALTQTKYIERVKRYNPY